MKSEPHQYAPKKLKLGRHHLNMDEVKKLRLEHKVDIQPASLSHTMGPEFKHIYHWNEGRPHIIRSHTHEQVKKILDAD